MGDRCLLKNNDLSKSALPKASNAWVNHLCINIDSAIRIIATLDTYFTHHTNAEYDKKVANYKQMSTKLVFNGDPLKLLKLIQSFLRTQWSQWYKSNTKTSRIVCRINEFVNYNWLLMKNYYLVWYPWTW